MMRRTLQILWPAFVAAGVLEMGVFAVIDPAELRWFGGTPIGWSAHAVYTLTFLMFWAAIATAGAVSALLSVEPDAVNWRE
jgi:phosphatidylserine synthase